MTLNRPPIIPHHQKERSDPHFKSFGIIDRLVLDNRPAAFAQNFDLPDRLCHTRLQMLAGDITGGNRTLAEMAIAARGDPADHRAVLPHRLVPQRIGIQRVDDKGDPLPVGALLLFQQGRTATDEIGL